MADAVNTQIILNGPRNLVMKFTNLSDGTGESLVRKVDAQSSTFAVGGQVPGTHLKIQRVEYDVRAGALDMFWDANTPDRIATLSDAGTMNLDEHYMVPNSLATGATGSILFSTVAFALNSSYVVIMHMIKGVPQN